MKIHEFGGTKVFFLLKIQKFLEVHQHELSIQFCQQILSIFHCFAPNFHTLISQFSTIIENYTKPVICHPLRFGNSQDYAALRKTEDLRSASKSKENRRNNGSFPK